MDYRTTTEHPVIQELVAEMPPEPPGRGSAVAVGFPNSPVGRLGRAARAATQALEVDAVIAVTFWRMSFGGGIGVGLAEKAMKKYRKQVLR